VGHYGDPAASWRAQLRIWKEMKKSKLCVWQSRARFVVAPKGKACYDCDFLLISLPEKRPAQGAFCLAHFQLRFCSQNSSSLDDSWLFLRTHIRKSAMRIDKANVFIYDNLASKRLQSS